MPGHSGLETNQMANDMLYSMDTSKWWYKADRLRDIFLDIAHQGVTMRGNGQGGGQQKPDKGRQYAQLGVQAGQAAIMAGGMGLFGGGGTGTTIGEIDPYVGGEVGQVDAAGAKALSEGMPPDISGQVNLPGNMPGNSITLGPAGEGGIVDLEGMGSLSQGTPGW